ncbi:hypothetical protein LTR67_008525 [Exophiala xenobiotica]
MVTSFEPSGNSPQMFRPEILQQDRRGPTPAFPLSSPPNETFTTFKPTNGGTSLATNNPFLSSNAFASSLSEDESASSSGEDEFHLERYSQDAPNNRPTTRPGQKTPFWRKKQHQTSTSDPDRRRPGLNIVTNFSVPSQRSRTEGILVDKVQSQRPQLGQRYATALVSAKAEHVNQTMVDALEYSMGPTAFKSGAPIYDRKRGQPAQSRWQELQAAPKNVEGGLEKQQAVSLHDHASMATIDLDSARGKDFPPDDRSVVIGLSVPQSEADAHPSKHNLDSAVSAQTPETPAIVITPAEVTDTWKPSFLRKARPSSSIYSVQARSHNLKMEASPPPVPRLPRAHVRESLPVVGASIEHSSEVSNRGHEEDWISDDEKDSEFAESLRRASSESQEHIFPLEVDQARPRSQGWWNLMLSPMLSRKGTISDNTRVKDIQRPPVPSTAGFEKHKSVSSLVAESPETPRRLGLASPRASMSSRWTFWAKGLGKGVQEDQVETLPVRLQESSPPAEEAKALPSCEPFDYLGTGLAAEYYHACAVEQLSGTRYFECQNHSCEEKSPLLHSIFEPKVLGEVDAQENNATRVSGNATPGDASEERVKSHITVHSAPEEQSPIVREANAAIVTKARAVEAPVAAEKKSSDMKPVESAANEKSFPTQEEARSFSSSPPHRNTQLPNIAAVAPAHVVQPPVRSPGPVSPGMQQTMTSQGAVPMSEITRPSNEARSAEQTTIPPESQTWAQTQPPSVTIQNHTTYAEWSRHVPGPVALQARKEIIDSPPEATSIGREMDRSATQKPKPTSSQEIDAPKKPGIFSKLKSLLKMKGSQGAEDSTRKKRRWTLIVAIPLLLIVIACILLATLLTRKGDGTPVQSQWLNLTGYPPIPTGISTIAMPDAVKEQPGCVAPTTMWSCALPKENQAEIAPNNPDQPNFRFEITFKNGTVPANLTIPVHKVSKRASNLSSRANDPFTDDLFDSNPAPPSRADQIFMGNTTDNITTPFQGEDTPFFMTFVPVFPVDPSNATQSSISPSSARLLARQASNNSDSIPAPDVLDDGSAAPANLLPTSPYPTSQPIKLYNRGQVDEHFGFYMYYDKSIFLHSTAPLNTSEFANNNGIDPQDQDGGSTRDQSRLRCTFSQTRFLVRIYTNTAFGATLLSPISGTNSTSMSNNSATNFNRPGSFPYPTTISLDRHGGNINKKAVYCYGVDDLQVTQDDVKSIVPELRGVGGQLINPAPPLVNGNSSSDATATDGFDPEAGGIDGGSGGCECSWQNWN